MNKAAVDLMMVYLFNARPGFEKEPTLEVVWNDVGELIFSFLPHITSVADEAAEAGHVWTEQGVDDLDDMLIEIAESGCARWSVSCSPAGIFELERRCTWAVIGSVVEEEYGKVLDLPSPRFASDEIRGTALFLFTMAGPARDYRLEACKR